MGSYVRFQLGHSTKTFVCPIQIRTINTRLHVIHFNWDNQHKAPWELFTFFYFTIYFRQKHKVSCAPSKLQRLTYNFPCPIKPWGVQTWFTVHYLS